MLLSMDASLEEKLELIKDVKRFCTEELGIAENTAFTKTIKAKYYYGLHASPKDAIRDHFNTPEGFQDFSSDYKCKKAAKELAALGYDVNIFRSEVAVDKVGCTIVDMPQITQGFLKQDAVDLITGVIHENIHVDLGERLVDISLPIEEAIACNIQFSGAKIYCKDDAKLQDRIVRYDAYYSKYFKWCHDYRLKLEEKYVQDYNEGRKMLHEAQMNYVKKFKGSESINNSFFAIYKYFEEYDAVKEILGDRHPKEILQKLYSYKSRIENRNDLKKVMNS
jgi:predicted aminopeptidase